MSDRLRSLSRQVAELSSRAVRAARQVGRDDLADRLTTVASRWADAEVTVAVVGRSRSGSSTLVAALTDRFDLVPHGDPTRCPTIVRVGEPDRRQVTLDGLDEPIDLPVDRAVVEDLPGEPMIVEISGSLATPDGLVLVDTPGLGSAHTAMDEGTRELLQRVDGVVFASDVSGVLTAGEVELLTHAVHAGARLRVVVARSDVSYSADALRDEVAAQLRTVGIDTEVAAVSAELYRRSRSAPAALRVTLEPESGIPGLRGWLVDEVVDKRRTLRLEALAGTSLGVVADLQGREHALIAASQASAEQRAAQVLASQEAIRLARERSGAILTALADGSSLLRDRITLELTRRTGEVRERLDEVASGRNVDEDALREEVGPLLARVRFDVERLVERELAALLERLGLDALQPPDVHFDDDGDPDVQPPSAAADAGLRLRVAAAMASGGGGLMMASSFIGQGRAPFMLAAVVLGSVAAAANMRSNAVQRDHQAVRAAVRQVVDQWRATAQTEMRGAVVTLQRQLESLVRDHLRAQIAELEDRLDQARRLSGAAERERAAERAQAERRLLDLDALEGELHALQLELAIPLEVHA